MRICSLMGIDVGVGVGCVGLGVEVGVDGIIVVGKGVGRRILNFRNMKVTELWKLVFGVVFVVIGILGSLGVFVIVFFRFGGFGIVFFIFGMFEIVFFVFGIFIVIVGLVCIIGLGILRGGVFVIGFFIFKFSVIFFLSE